MMGVIDKQASLVRKDSRSWVALFISRSHLANCASSACTGSYSLCTIVTTVPNLSGPAPRSEEGRGGRRRPE